MCLRSQRGCQDPSVLRVGVRAAPLAVAAERALRAPASGAQRAHALPARPRPSEVAWRRAYLHRSRDAARRASALRCTWRRLRSGSRHVASFSWVIWIGDADVGATAARPRASARGARGDGAHEGGWTLPFTPRPRDRLPPRWRDTGGRRTSAPAPAPTIALARPCAPARARRYSTSSTQRPQSSALTARRRSVSARASVRRLHCGPRAPLRAPRAALAL